MALMASVGEIEPMPDAAIFADTKAEPQSVYRWLDWLERQLPFPVVRVSKGDLAVEALRVRRSRNGNYWSGGWPPLYAVGPSGKPSPMMRQCTQDFKIKPIHSVLRQYKPVVQWIGISIDEAHRIKPSQKSWIENRYPLIDLRMKRHDCLLWMERRGYPKPPRSACVFCPFMSDLEWLRLKTDEPDDFQRAVEFEVGMQATKAAVGFTGEVRLHRSMKPIDRVEFDSSRNQIDLFGNECYGMCGV